MLFGMEKKRSKGKTLKALYELDAIMRGETLLVMTSISKEDL